MKFTVTYYRTLIYEGEREAETLDQAQESAQNEISRMENADFDEIHEEAAEINGAALQIPVTVVFL